MDKDEFIEKVYLHNQYANKMCVVGWSTFIVEFGLIIFYNVKETSFSYGNKIFIPCLMVVSFASVIVFLWLNVRDMRKFGLFCPKCNKLIDMKKSKKYLNEDLCQSVLFSLKCSKCGEYIIENNGSVNNVTL